MGFLKNKYVVFFGGVLLSLVVLKLIKPVLPQAVQNYL